VYKAGPFEFGEKKTQMFKVISKLAYFLSSMARSILSWSPLLVFCIAIQCEALSVSSPNAQDTRRAMSMPADSFRAPTFEAMTKNLNSILVTNDAATLRPCASYNITELNQLLSLLLSARSPELQEIYERNNDTRSLPLDNLEETWVKELKSLNAAKDDYYSAALRDGKCHQAMMVFVHHLSESSREEALELTQLPLLPTSRSFVGTTEQLDGARAHIKQSYSDMISCSGCHLSATDTHDSEHKVKTMSGVNIPIWGAAKHFNVNVNMTNPSDSPAAPFWTFEYYYDTSGAWTVSRYEFDKTQHDEVCRQVKGKSGKCTVIHAYDKYIYIEFPDEKYCCKCGQDPGAVRTDWLDEGSTYKGQSTVNGELVDEWLKQGASDNHYYASADAKQLPVRYMEHKNGKVREYEYH
jgi:hypothetical protein